MTRVNEKADNYNICPFVGNREDAETAQLYPSELNCCNHAKPVQSIQYDKQKKYCLTNNYSTCPIFLKEKIDKLPPEFINRAHGQNRHALYQALLLILVLAVAFLMIANSNGLIHITFLDGLFAPRQKITAAPIVTTVSPTATNSQTPTQKQVPSNTPVVLSPTQVPMHQLETPMGANNAFVIHKVLEGESFINLAETYKTTKEAILAVNYNLQSVLWANSLVVIPVGITDVSSFPAFSIYTIDRTGETIEKLASEQDADMALLKKYNAYPDGYVLQKGEYVLIPHTKAANQ